MGQLYLWKIGDVLGRDSVLWLLEKLILLWMEFPWGRRIMNGNSHLCPLDKRMTNCEVVTFYKGQFP